ncbi:hypothetical protein KKA14_02740 [bacterium]|nr:hypothetical protein [bacterium]
MTDKQRVVKYLNRLMESKFFSIDDLESLSVEDLLNDSPVQDLDGSFLEDVLNSYKKDYKSGLFED